VEEGTGELESGEDISCCQQVGCCVICAVDCGCRERVELELWRREQGNWSRSCAFMLKIYMKKFIKNLIKNISGWSISSSCKIVDEINTCVMYNKKRKS
jgi:hypothetical protein